MSVCQCGRSIGIGLLCWYGTVHERGGQSWMSWRACAHCHRECHCHSLTLQKVLRSSLVIGWCRQLASCVLSLARRGSYGSGALPALVALMSVCVCDLRCWWHGMAAVCVRHSDVSGVWASLGCKCLFASVGGALALAVVLVWDGACEGEGRAR